MSVTVVPLRRRMTARDPREHGRVATPLELFFDLVFVVAVASAADELHHALSADHLDGMLGFTLVFFAIWWAWLNYTWFASAYDCDDVVYRLLTFVIMTGSLLLAAGVPDLFADGQSVLAVLGYLVMRLGMVAFWLRAASGHPERRRTALTYAAGIAIVQVGWVARLLVHGEGWLLVTFLLGVLAELSVPVVAEVRGGYTSYHPRHIAERFALFTIIVLGEVVLATVRAMQQAVGGGEAGHGEAGGDPTALLVLTAGALLIVLSLWWLYFTRDHGALLAEPTASTWAFGYGHVVVFAAVAAVGAALAAAVDVVAGTSHTAARTVALALAVPIALYALVLAGLHAVADRRASRMTGAVVVGLGVLGVAALGGPLPVTVLLVGLVLTGAVVQHVVAASRLGEPATGPPTELPEAGR